MRQFERSFTLPSPSHFSLFTSLLTLDTARMTQQGLTDRLVVATEEQDILYVLHWLREMKDQDCLEEAINNKREFILTLHRY